MIVLLTFIMIILTTYTLIKTIINFTNFIYLLYYNHIFFQKLNELMVEIVMFYELKKTLVLKIKEVVEAKKNTNKKFILFITSTFTKLKIFRYILSFFKNIPPRD